MKIINQDPNPRKGFKLIIALFIILSFVLNAFGQIRKVEISSIIDPVSSDARSFFGNAYRFAGGVVPRGKAEFVTPEKTKISINELQLVITDKEKLKNGNADYNSIGIKWKGKVYQLTTAQDDMIYPIMKFIQRDSFIAFTLPIVDFNQKYFDDNALFEVEPIGYATKEFVDYGPFLHDVDVETSAEPLAFEIAEKIKQDLNIKGNELKVFGTFVNADFHVTYKVFLESKSQKNVAEIGGLPLRYSWSVGSSGAIIRDVRIFRFPEKDFDLQYQAILFFQTVALLRQFKQTNGTEFDRFMKEVSAVVEK